MQHLVKQQSDRFFKYRNADSFKNLHEVHSTHGQMSFEQFRAAIQDFGIKISFEEANIAFKCADVNQNMHLDSQEFCWAARECHSLVGQWIGSFDIHELLGRCLSFHEYSEEVDELELVSQLEEEDICIVLDVFKEDVKRILLDEISTLRDTLKVMKSRESGCFQSGEGGGIASKFRTLKMNSGGVKDFHRGLEGRVGAPLLNITKGIHDEHCERIGHDVPFTTDNYGITTTPEREHGIVTGTVICPAEEMLDKEKRVVRRIPSWSEIKSLEGQMGLCIEEIFAVILHTGPMFQVYNAILRRFPAETFKIYKNANHFPTTIHVLVSAIVKVAATARLPAGLVLYRGMGGLAELPDSFYRGDKNGCKGCMEWGFLSTTTNKAIAVQCSGVKEGRPRAMVLQITAGAIDRGACIVDMSQYPGEREYLWVPCSFLEPNGSAKIELVHGTESQTGDGSAMGIIVGAVLVQPVRINANLKSLTVEDMKCRKYNEHYHAFRYIVDETINQLQTTEMVESFELRLQKDWSSKFSLKKFLEGGGIEQDVDSLLVDSYGNIVFTHTCLVNKIKREMESVLEYHKQLNHAIFNDVSSYRSIVQEMLEVQIAAFSFFHSYVSNSHQSISWTMRMPLMQGHRVYQSFLWLSLQQEAVGQKKKASLLCQIMGLASKDDIDATDLNGLTALMRCAASGVGERAIKCLVEARAQVNAADKILQRTPVYLAAEFGHAHTIEVLVSLGADVRQKAHAGSYDCTPVYVAALEGHSEAVEVLARCGADLDEPDNRGRTPAFMAAEQGRVDVLKKLAAAVRPADFNKPNERGTTPVINAAIYGQAAALSALHDLGAKLDQSDEDGQTPAYLAALHGNFQALEELIRLGADVQRPAKNGKKPADAAREGLAQKRVEAEKSGWLLDLQAQEDYLAVLRILGDTG